MDTTVNTPKQLLSFVLDEELHALDIARVREVLEYQPLTKIPMTPEFFKGVINLRGHGVPVADLRLKFGMPGRERTVDTCVIIAEVSLGGEQVVLGIMVDSVREVVDVDRDSVLPPPNMGSGVKTEFIQGMGKINDQFILIMDVDTIFSDDELAAAMNMNDFGPGAESGQATEAQASAQL